MRARLLISLATCLPALVAAGNAQAGLNNHVAGKTAFDANCAVCHQAGAVGMEGLAPPLTDFPAIFSAHKAGRKHLISTVLYGMDGPITVGGHHYNFKMPNFSRLSNRELVSILNYLVFDVDHANTNLVQAYTPTAIAAVRKIVLTSDQNHHIRGLLTKKYTLTLTH